jgi:mannose-6-phosphate isomerase
MTTPLYPLRFTPIFKERPWGGDKIRTVLGKEAPAHLKIGESWEISDRGSDATAVADGPCAGIALHRLMETMGKLLLGDRVLSRHPKRFPLLYKILDVEALLSLQVHPPDGYPNLRPGEEGKSEFWYVLSASPGASVFCGLKAGADKRTFKRLLNERRVEKLLGEYAIAPGAGISIPAGRLHTAGPSSLILEIQTNSDTTYRVWDWGRTGADGKPRELHLEQALEVIDWKDGASPLVEPAREKTGENEIALLLITEHFTVERVAVKKRYDDLCDGSRFQVLSAVEGEGEIVPERAGSGPVRIRRGDFILLPAYLGAYTLRTDQGVTVLKSYIT